MKNSLFWLHLCFTLFTFYGCKPKDTISPEVENTLRNTNWQLTRSFGECVIVRSGQNFTYSPKEVANHFKLSFGNKPNATVQYIDEVARKVEWQIVNVGFRALPVYELHLKESSGKMAYYNLDLDGNTLTLTLNSELIERSNAFPATSNGKSGGTDVTYKFEKK